MPNPGSIGIIGPKQQGMNSRQDVKTPEEAAKAFETLLLNQLFKAMWKTVGKSGLSGKGFQSNLYSDMFVSSLAESVSERGIGISDMVNSSMTQSTGSLDTSLSTHGFQLTKALKAYRSAGDGHQEVPVNGHLASVAQEFIQNKHENWGVSGELTENDLGADILTEGKGGLAAFNVRDANGYQGHPKCNLFSFEMLRRAGYQVPVVPRNHGWGYPGADSVTNWAHKGDVNNWAQVETSKSTEQLHAMASSGTPLLLTSSAPDGHAGHMGVADQVHNIIRDEQGNISVIEYSGWEAGNKGANYGRHVWRVSGISGKGRGGLDQIQVLKPRYAQKGNEYTVARGGKPGASLKETTILNLENKVQSKGADK